MYLLLCYFMCKFNAQWPVSCREFVWWSVPYCATSWRMIQFFVFAHYKSSKILCITHLFYWFVTIQFDKSYWTQRIFLSVLVMFSSSCAEITRKFVRLVNCYVNPKRSLFNEDAVSSSFTRPYWSNVIRNVTTFYFSKTTLPLLIIVLFILNSSFKEFLIILDAYNGHIHLIRLFK